MVEKFAIMKRNHFLNKDNEFSSPSLYHTSTEYFISEDEALDKAESLGINLDDIDIIEVTKKSPK